MAKATNKLIFGVGINDSGYTIKKIRVVGYKDSGKKIQKIIWICPFYQKWVAMLERCYCSKRQNRQPVYKGCSTVPEWHLFSNFKSWMEQQEWEGKALDKDLLVPGNKVYGPDTCVFVSKLINNFLTESTAKRGELPIGVGFNKNKSNYIAYCNDFRSGNTKYLGNYSTPEEAHQAWLEFKLSLAKILASEETDTRIAKALVARYENYQ